MQGQNYNCHKNKIRTNEPKIWKNNKNTETLPNFKIRTNEPKIWKNNKNTETLPNLSGSYKNKTRI